MVTISFAWHQPRRGHAKPDIPAHLWTLMAEVQARTTRMSTPHLIDYTYRAHGPSLGSRAPAKTRAKRR